MAVAIQSVGTGTQASDTTSLTITAPSGIVDGNLLLALIARDDDADGDVTSSGWSRPSWSISEGDTGELGQGDYLISVLTKIADGESGDYTFSWTGNQQACGAILRIDGHHPTEFLYNALPGYASDYQFNSMPYVHCPVAGCLYIGAVSTDNADTFALNGGNFVAASENAEITSGGGESSLYVFSYENPSIGMFAPSPGVGHSFSTTASPGNEMALASFSLIPSGINPGIGIFRHPGMTGGFLG